MDESSLALTQHLIGVQLIDWTISARMNFNEMELQEFLILYVIGAMFSPLFALIMTEGNFMVLRPSLFFPLSIAQDGCFRYLAEPVLILLMAALYPLTALAYLIRFIYVE